MTLLEELEAVRARRAAVMGMRRLGVCEEFQAICAREAREMIDGLRGRCHPELFERVTGIDASHLDSRT